MTEVPYYLFEDPGWRRFGPLTTIRPIWKVRVGLDNLEANIARQMERTPSGYLPRETMNRLIQEEHGETSTYLPKKGEVLLVNGRAWRLLPKEGLDIKHPWAVWTDGGDVVAVRLPVNIAAKWLSQPLFDPEVYSSRKLLAIWSYEQTVPEVRVIETKGSLIYWPWELLHKQEEAIRESFDRHPVGDIGGDVHYRAILVEEEKMAISPGVEVSAGAVIDASKGPVMLMEGVKVMPNAVIIGPAAIGENTLIRVGAKLYGPLSIGPVCKIGGEVEECIFQGYSNKQHEGFLGHALVGEWVNLGADTNNSDLKNNYSTVSVVIDGETINTGEQFFGSIIGDHVKTGINTMLNTGTVIGVGSSIFGAGFPPKSIAPFSWGGAEEMMNYDFQRFIDTARTVMKRRKVEMSSAMAALLRQVHNETRATFV